MPQAANSGSSIDLRLRLYSRAGDLREAGIPSRSKYIPLGSLAKGAARAARQYEMGPRWRWQVRRTARMNEKTFLLHPHR